MTTRKISAGLLLAVLAGIFALLPAGCSKDSPMPNDMTGTGTNKFTTNPVNGATGVRMDEAITLTFAKRVERETVEEEFHLIGRYAMEDSLCPMSGMMNGGGMMSDSMMGDGMMGTEMMNMAMGDSMIMSHLLDRHQTHGEFVWSADSLSCTFRPDSFMMPNMQYMMHMGRGMMEMMANRMGSGMGSGSMHDAGMTNGQMMYHFQTLDPGAAGGGNAHDDHH